MNSYAKFFKIKLANTWKNFPNFDPWQHLRICPRLSLLPRPYLFYKYSPQTCIMCALYVKEINYLVIFKNSACTAYEKIDTSSMAHFILQWLTSIDLLYSGDGDNELWLCQLVLKRGVRKKGVLNIYGSNNIRNCKKRK